MKIKRLLAVLICMMFITSMIAVADMSDSTDSSDGEGILEMAKPLTFSIEIDETEGCEVKVADASGAAVDLSAVAYNTTVILTATVTDASAEFEKWQKKTDGVFVDVPDAGAVWSVKVTQNMNIKAVTIAKKNDSETNTGGNTTGSGNTGGIIIENGNSNSGGNGGNGNSGGGGVSFKPTAPQQNTTAKASFGDIENHWAKANIVRAVEMGMFNGVAENTFDPEGTTTRGMIITIIARMNGVDLSGYQTSGFSDVNAGEWYAAAVEWGSQNGIVTGVSETSFDPNGLLTREQIATIIYRYAGKYGKDVSKKADISGFGDFDSVSEYASDAIAWANASGIVTGREGNLIDPQGTATRAEVATMLMRYLDNVD